MENKNKAKLIVIIEDEDTLANIMQIKLEKAGYRVVVARDGEDGLKLIHSMKPDLVLLDLLLPIKNGYEVLEELHNEKALPDLPVIVISNSGQSVEVERILKFGIRDYLIKLNFSPQEVLSKVEQVFSGADVGGTNGTNKHEASVLIVEDDLILVDLLERKFKEKFNVYRATNVNEARRILATNAIDVILLDIVLPDIDGFTFLAELKQGVAKKIPVVIISNLGQKEEIERGLKLGASDYVIKANSLPGEIIEKVSSLLRKQRLN